MKRKEMLYPTCAGVLGGLLLAGLPASAQTAANAAGQATNQVGATTGQVRNTVNGVTNQLPNTLGQVGNTTNGLVNGLQPTLQPVGQGVGNALNNLTQPDNISALLEFLSSIVPNHIEAHVNLDALRVEKVTLDIRGVDLRNLKVDLLVANSRNAGVVRPAMTPGSQTANPNNTNSMMGNQTMSAPTGNPSNGTQPLTFAMPSNSTTNR